MEHFIVINKKRIAHMFPYPQRFPNKAIPPATWRFITFISDNQMRGDIRSIIEFRAITKHRSIIFMMEYAITWLCPIVFIFHTVVNPFLRFVQPISNYNVFSNFLRGSILYAGVVVTLVWSSFCLRVSRKEKRLCENNSRWGPCVFLEGTRTCTRSTDTTRHT